MLKIVETQIPGCFRINPAVHQDSRGTFVKILKQDKFAEYGLATHFAEEFYTESVKGVVRGLHFQTPPMPTDKLIYCISGHVLDVVVDLRVGSPTYGKHELFELTSNTPSVLYVSEGLAHGFLALSDKAIMSYSVTAPHHPDVDKGLHWDSCGISWPIKNPILSARDAALPAFKDFKSPFIYTPPRKA